MMDAVDYRPSLPIYVAPCRTLHAGGGAAAQPSRTVVLSAVDFSVRQRRPTHDSEVAWQCGSRSPHDTIGQLDGSGGKGVVASSALMPHPLTGRRQAGATGDLMTKENEDVERERE